MLTNRPVLSFASASSRVLASRLSRVRTSSCSARCRAINMLSAFLRATERRRVSSSSSKLSARDHSSRELGTTHPGLDFRKRGIASRRGVVAERREAAVIRGAKTLDGDVLRSLEHEVTNFFRGVYVRIDRRHDTNEDLATRPHMLAQHPENALMIALSSQRHAEVAEVQLEEAR